MDNIFCKELARDPDCILAYALHVWIQAPSRDEETEGMADESVID